MMSDRKRVIVGSTDLSTTRKPCSELPIFAQQRGADLLLVTAWHGPSSYGALVVWPDRALSIRSITRWRCSDEGLAG